MNESDVAKALTMATKEGMTFSDIARMLIPERKVKSAMGTIARRLRQLLPPEEYKELVERNVKIGTSKGGFSHHPEGIDTAELLVTPGEVKSDWLDDELRDLVEFVAEGKCIYPKGLHAGEICWRMIAQLLNDRYKDVRPNRNANACYRRYKRLTDASADVHGNNAVS